jgi:AraC-like DNA-binding protein
MIQTNEREMKLFVEELSKHTPFLLTDCFVPMITQWESKEYQLLLTDGNDPPCLYVDNELILRSTEQIVLIQPGKLVRIEGQPNNLKSIAFRSPFLDRFLSTYRIKLPLSMTLDPPTKQQYRMAWCEQATQCDLKQKIQSSIYLYALLASLFEDMPAVMDTSATDNDLPSKPKKGGDGRTIIYAARYIKKEIGNADLSLNDIARAVAYNPNYFSQEFKRITRISPIKFVNRLRIDMALELLVNTDEPIHSICRKTGIKKPSQLSAMVKARTAMTPSEYRRVNKLFKIM